MGREEEEDSEGVQEEELWAHSRWDRDQVTRGQRGWVPQGEARQRRREAIPMAGHLQLEEEEMERVLVPPTGTKVNPSQRAPLSQRKKRHSLVP